jgi:hypothetical protein
VTTVHRCGGKRRHVGKLRAGPKVADREFTVTVFPGLSVISGTADALASVRDLRSAAFVDCLAKTRTQLAEAGWTTEGSLGAGSSLLARDPAGMLAEFVEISGGTA